MHSLSVVRNYYRNLYIYLYFLSCYISGIQPTMIEMGMDIDSQ